MDVGARRLLAESDQHEDCPLQIVTLHRAKAAAKTCVVGRNVDLEDCSSMSLPVQSVFSALA